MRERNGDGSLTFCQPHWDALRAEIERQGLAPLVPESRSALFARMKAEPSEPFGGDPLLTCCAVLTKVAAAQTVACGRAPAGCPVCLLTEVAINPGEDWIKGAVKSWRAEQESRAS